MPVKFVYLLTACMMAFASNPALAKDSIDTKVDELMAKMTLSEKVGQLNQYSLRDATGPDTGTPEQKRRYKDLTRGMVGSVLNVTGAERVHELQKVAVGNSRLGIPLIFALDVIHGHKTVFPIPLAEAASWDLQAIEKSARIAATEASARGINWTFSPMVDISRDARWGRVMEGAGEDPFLGQLVAAARVRGFQGDDLSRNDTIAATAKHFAGYGFSEAGRDYNLVDVGNYTLYNTILPPFKAAVDADVRSVMTAFNTLNGIPATGSHFLLSEVLKEQWNFGGFIVTDWASGLEMMVHGFVANEKDAAEVAINAGSDMDMQSYIYIDHLEALVKEGKVSMARLDDAVRRVLRVKFELGLFDDPYRYASVEREKALMSHPDHLAAALNIAKRSIVLLKNENKLLPLSKQQKNIAVIGDFADDKSSPLGSWRFGADEESAVSLLEGLQAYTDQITFARGTQVAVGRESFSHVLKTNMTDRSEFGEAIELAKKSDLVIMMLGEHSFHSGEARSRTRIGLPGLQQELLEAVYAVNNNIVLVVANGRPLVLNWAEEHIPAILVAWQLGTQNGNAISQVLFGDYNPSGKLPMTFPRAVGQVPIYYGKYNTGRPNEPEDGVVWWSHYEDESNDPLYPFGYGLSYTEFKYSDLKTKVLSNNKVQVQVTIKNTGDFDGEEIVQLYLHDKVASVVRPSKELKGFEKISLKKGQKKKIEFVLTEKELGFYNLDGEFVFEPGEFGVMVGTNSDKGLVGSFKL